MSASVSAFESRADVRSDEERIERLRQASLTALRAISDVAEPVGAAELLRSMRKLPDVETLAIWRGRVDAHALRLRFSDAVLHAQLAPGGAAASIFDALEQCRVEALGVRLFPGVGANLRAFHDASDAEIRGGDDFGRAFGGTRALVDKAMVSLATLIDDQRAFGVAAAKIATELASANHLDNNTADAPPDPSRQRTDASRQPTDAEQQSERTSPSETDAAAENTHVDILRRVSNEPRGRVVPRFAAAEGGDAAYRVFTRQFDAVVDAASLLDDDKRRQLSQHFETLRTTSQRDIARWAHRLQRHLLSRQRRSWAFDCEEGLLDSSRLARVICDPLQPLLFKQEAESDWPETAVTVLIDNSGSMRGLPIVIASVCAELLGAVLERCGVTTEILGFTTQRWRGGRSRERWIAMHRPPHPGRLTDLLHVIYKSADIPWRHARRNLVAMLDEPLLKENVDGEALQWAYQRLRRRPEHRRILMVISDGAPLDDATLSANDFSYLDRHLRKTIGELEASEAVELLAIGIGHDVGSYYANAFTVTEPQELGEAMVRQLVRGSGP